MALSWGISFVYPLGSAPFVRFYTYQWRYFIMFYVYLYSLYLLIVLNNAQPQKNRQNRLQQTRTEHRCLQGQVE